MEVAVALGLRAGLITVDEALAGDWRGTPGLDLVKVVDPPPVSWAPLTAAGFRVQPAWITWTAPVGPSEAEFLTRLPRKERYHVRAGQKAAAEQGVRLKVVTPLDAPSFDEFLGLYEPQVAAMRHGVPYASMERDEILDQGEDYFAVQAYAPDGLVGSCVCRIRRDISTVVIRFATTAPGGRQQGLVRALYMRVFEAAREMGHREISLGSDPALYGHMTKPGLFAFKSGLRFTPVPSRLFGSMDDPDEATRVVSLERLTDPSLMISYQVDANTRVITADTPLRLDSVTADPTVERSAYDAPFAVDTGVILVP
ncbi:GNAT family N-acetyltransferase [Saccharothrix syringae]|uniref:N-acetyltransferase domain-containing protein n=1 Tax=Saccharothrix syringae TaxID=103733 RepID=A0A5Q0H5U1_SACSY|nr:GNAT family N-acetyltransferase [Saccharothrix syringae]QFZ21210.1 hypothetical protein EKG83_30900 [Saccharothrix syringae]